MIFQGYRNEADKVTFTTYEAMDIVDNIIDDLAQDKMVAPSEVAVNDILAFIEDQSGTLPQNVDRVGKAAIASALHRY